MKNLESKIPHFSGYLTGQLLVAMPHIQDPRFQKSVIFLCGHDESGAMGLIINRVLEDLTLEDLLQQTENMPLPVVQDFPIYFGGPIEGSRGFVLHTADYQHTTTLRIGKYFGITATTDILSVIAAGQGPRHVLLALGYTGWGAHQLDKEIQHNTWVQIESDEELVFGDVPEKKWHQAISRLGVEEFMLVNTSGHA